MDNNNFNNDPNNQDQNEYTDPGTQHNNAQYSNSNAQYSNNQHSEPNAQYNNTQYSDPNAQYSNTQYSDPNAQYGNTQFNQYGTNTQYNPYGQGQYTNMGGAPLDKNGNPMPNRFGMKLTFSILEIFSIVFCNLVAMIMGIIGCVFTSKANTAYKEGRWEDFKNNAKTATICLWIGFATDILVLICYIALAVIGVGIFSAMWKDPEFQDILQNGNNYDYNYDYNYNSDNDAEDSDLDDYNTGSASSAHPGTSQITDPNLAGEFYAVNLEGSQITLPIVTSEFLATGLNFGADVDVAGTMINAGEFDVESLYNASGEYLGSAIIRNTGDAAVALQDAVVTGFDVYNDAALYDSGFNPVFQLGNGIDFTYTEDQIFEVLGEPYYSDDDDTNSYDSYSWYIGDNYDTISVYFEGGALYELSVDYTGQ